MNILKETIKNNPYVYKIFSLFGKIYTAIVKFVVPINDHKILFISYGGTKVADSPMYIYKKMLQDSYFDDYLFVWAVTGTADVSSLQNSRTEIISADRISYFRHLFSSKIWITNTTVFRGLSLKAPQDVIYINTWHGTPLKKIGSDALINSPLVQKGISFNKSNPNCIYLAQSRYEASIYKRAFRENLKSVVITGLPRNDILFESSRKKVDKESLLLKTGISTKRKVILYAPTFREEDDLSYVEEKIELIESLNKEYYVLYRGHHASKDKQIFNNLDLDNYKDVSDYQDLNNLLLVSDILITDYSSICVDFAILNKPVYFFTYDLYNYEQTRGLYIDFFNFFKGVYFNSNTLLEEIMKDDAHKAAYENTKIIRKTFLEEIGSGTTNAINLIKELENN